MNDNIITKRRYFNLGKGSSDLLLFYGKTHPKMGLRVETSGVEPLSFLLNNK
jgi:hypothetical protein